MSIDVAAASAFLAGHGRILDRRRFELLVGPADSADSADSSDGVLRKKLWMMSETVELDMEFSAEDREPIAAPRIPATSRPEITTGSPCRMKLG